MDSLSKLKRGIIRTNNCELDQDVIINLNWQDLTEWCKRIIIMDQNIKETSISNSHKTERRAKVINQILGEK